MKRLLIICQKVDNADDLLGFFGTWIAEFAKHFQQVTVITLAKGEYSLPPHVKIYSLGKENQVSKARQVWRLFRLLWREVRNHDAVFAHMSPIFAIYAWPFTFLWHKKLVLWYLHRSNTLRLRVALAMCNTMVTADASSLTIQSPKIIAVGHGIDISRFSDIDRLPPVGRPLRILSVGRISPIKGFETLIRASAHLRDMETPCEVRIVGKAVMAGDHNYAQELQSQIGRLGVGDIVHFFGFVPYYGMPSQYAWADIVVGCTPRGGIDKVLLEGMAAGCVVLTSNIVMVPYLAPFEQQLVFGHDDARDLAEKINTLGDLGEISARMVANVRRDHDVSRTIASIAKIV